MEDDVAVEIDGESVAVGTELRRKKERERRYFSGDADFMTGNGRLAGNCLLDLPANSATVVPSNAAFPA